MNFHAKITKFVKSSQYVNKIFFDVADFYNFIDIPAVNLVAFPYFSYFYLLLIPDLSPLTTSL